LPDSAFGTDEYLRLSYTTSMENISKELQRIEGLINKFKPLIDLPRMGKSAREMLKKSLDSFAGKDVNLAILVCKEDEEVDFLRDQVIRELITYIISDTSTIERSIQLISIARNLERVADLATNIAEDVVFTVKGEVIKHHRGEKK